MRERKRRHDDAHRPLQGRGKRATPPAAERPTLRIYFDDQGQEFLWWDLAPRGRQHRVVGCGPCLASGWSGVIVLGKIYVGARLTVRVPRHLGRRLLNYRINRLEPRDA